jgi:hypothetical protein
MVYDTADVFDGGSLALNVLALINGKVGKIADAISTGLSTGGFLTKAIPDAIKEKWIQNFLDMTTYNPLHKAETKEEAVVNRPGFRGDLILWEDRSWAMEAGSLRK